MEFRSERGRIFLSAVQTFGVVVDERGGGWKVSTQKYIYRVDTVEPGGGDALFEWHWHPPMRFDPHVHVRADHAELGDIHAFHLPTARVSFESVVRFLIQDLGVAARAGWVDQLAETEEAFRQFRTWH